MAGGLGDTAVQLLHADRCDLRPDRLHGAQRPADDDPHDSGQRRDRQRNDPGQRGDERADVLVDVLERGRREHHTLCAVRRDECLGGDAVAFSVVVARRPNQLSPVVRDDQDADVVVAECPVRHTVSGGERSRHAGGVPLQRVVELLDEGGALAGDEQDRRDHQHDGDGDGRQERDAQADRAATPLTGHLCSRASSPRCGTRHRARS